MVTTLEPANFSLTERIIVQNRRIRNIHVHDNRSHNFRYDIGRRHHLQQKRLLVVGLNLAPLPQITFLSERGANRRQCQCRRKRFHRLRSQARNGGVEDEMRSLIFGDRLLIARAHCVNFVQANNITIRFEFNWVARISGANSMLETYSLPRSSSNRCDFLPPS